MDDQPLPDILAGPLLRHLSPERLVLWLVGSRPLELGLHLYPEGATPRRLRLGGERLRRIPVGRHAWLHLIEVPLATPLPRGRRIGYDLRLEDRDGAPGIADWAPHLCHDGESRPAFVLAEDQRRLLHGSCRKPHHRDEDGLVRGDAWLAERHERPEEWPAWLLMTGDQIYADDVAGPMLAAIHALIRRLGLVDEVLEGATVADSQALYAEPAGYYRRESLLPDITVNAALRERFFGGARKPVFTSANAHNHLITFAEVMAMYLLVWSPVPWRLIDPPRPHLTEELAARYDEEQAVIDAFVAGLPQAARLLAHLPSLMIFDDHDVTDDWNLTAEWEACAYGHPFSRRILGNALWGYLLCQGWGNDPEGMAGLVERAEALLGETHEREEGLPAPAQDALLEALRGHRDWGFRVPGAPPLLVLDTRTRRWRNERRPGRPSGLMDWEALCELQQALLGSESVVIVSPAPMFGVKLIEGIQKLFVLAGKPLLVDAENWMAHRGAASVMLNIFRHSQTPGNYVILSGDVHYSFVYDIRIRHRRQGPRLWQITSSGIKNSFPEPLLSTFDRLNRWLYAPRSPLNWFTQRRPMRITPRDPDRAEAGERLWNGSGLGLVELDSQGRPARIRQLDVRGFEVDFPPPEAREAAADQAATSSGRAGPKCSK